MKNEDTDRISHIHSPVSVGQDFLLHSELRRFEHRVPEKLLPPPRAFARHKK